jgi:hypothetical protein
MNSTNHRPSVADIYCLLRADDSLIVHFSGTAPGTGNPNARLYYPDDLRNVVSGGAKGGVSCSVIKPGDTLGQLEHNNATGCIGVVLGLQSPTSLLDAHAGDGGSSVLPGGTRVANPDAFSIDNVKATLTGRHPHGYNEWVVGDYQALGIFVAAPYRVRAIVEIPGAEGVPAAILGSPKGPGYRYETIPDIQRDFPDQRIFAFGTCAIQELVGREWTDVPHSTIYV